MSLVLYSLMLFYPGGGGPAAGVDFDVTLCGSNVLSTLFTDAAGTTPQANPVTSDSMGMIAFYASPGMYRTDLAGSMFEIPIDESFTDPVFSDLWTHTQSSPASVWTIDHHFGTHPLVQVIASGVEVEAEVAHPSASQTTITFGVPVTGTAYLRR